MKRAFQTFKRALAMLLTLVLILGIAPMNAFAAGDGAAQFSDWPNDWSTEALQAAVDNELMVGYSGKILPKNNLTRAEMAAIINRAFGATEMASLAEFTDIPDNAWYRDNMAKAVKMGTFAGSGGGLMRPDEPITREEAFAVINRAFRLEAANQSALDKFKDKDDVSSWALPEVAAMAAAGYVNGDGINLKPKNNISRAEFAQVMHNIVKTYIKQSGAVSEVAKGNVLISAADVTLKDVTIDGDLIIGDGVGTGTITLENVTVTGRIVNRSGANIVYKEGTDTPTPGGGSGNTVTVTFETNGGSDVSPVTLNKGETLNSIPIPSKDGYAFTGWFADSTLQNDFYSGVPIDKNTTLYAKYAQRDNNLQEQVNPSLYLADCDQNFAVRLNSPVPLTSANLSDYIEMTANAPEGFPALNVAGGGGAYTLTPATPYDAGWLYTMTLKNDSLTFGSLYDSETAAERETDAGVRELSFRIHKDEVAEVTFAEGVIPVLQSDVTEDFGEGVYTIPADKYSRVQTMFDDYDAYNKAGPHTDTDPDTGETVTLPDKSVVICMISGAPAGFDISGNFDDLVASGALDGMEIEYLKVVNSTQYDMTTTPYILLQTDAQCLPGDIYTDLDLWQENYVDPELLWAAMGELDLDQIARDAANGEGARQLTELLNYAMAESPTVQALMESIDNGTYDSSMLQTLRLDAPQLLAAAGETRVPRPEHPDPSLLDDNGIYWPECFFEPGETDHGMRLTAKGFGVENLTVTAEVRGTDNANFPLAHPSNFSDMTEESWKNEYAGTVYENDWPNVWPMMVLKFEYEVTIKGKVKIAVEFEIREYLTMSFQGGAVYDGKFFYPSTWDDLYFDIAANIYSQTDLYLEVLVTSANEDDDDGDDDDDDDDDGFSLDITAEIGELMAGGGREPSEILEKVLGGKGEPIDVVNVDLIKVPFTLIPIVPVADLIVELDFVVRVNFAAGIASKFTYLCAQQIGVTGDLDKKVFATYKNAFHEDGLYEFDFYAAGYFGVEAGFKGKLGISLYGLSWLAKLGTSLEVGAYLDVYAFLRLSIGKYYNDVHWIYNKNTWVGGVQVGAWYMHSATPMKPKLSLQGGVYMETGIYVRLAVFAESEIFNVSKEAVLFKPKIPLFTLGEKYVLSKFKNANDTVRIAGEKTPLLGLGGLLEADYINMTRGKIETGMLAGLDRFEFQFSNPAFSRQGNDIVFDKTKVGDAVRADCKVTVYYKGGMLTFANKTWTLGSGSSEANYNNGNIDITSGKQIWLIWLDETLPEFADLTTPVKATYVLDVNGVQTLLQEKDVLPGNKPGGPVIEPYQHPNGTWYYLTLHEWLTKEKNVTVKNYDDWNQPITQDTVYTIYAESPQKLVSFLTLQGGKWHFDVYAVNAGELPTPPAGYDSSAQFLGWNENVHGTLVKGALKPVEIDYRLANQSFVYYGLDTTNPIFSVSGSFTDCDSAFYSGKLADGTRIYDAVQYAYEAQYDRGLCKVTVKWQSYEILDKTYSYSPVTCEIPSGNPFYLQGNWFDCGRGYKFAGIDITGDGVADYDENTTWGAWIANPPIVTGDMTVTILQTPITNTVTVLGYDGNIAGTETLNYGNTPSAMKNPPQPSDPDETFDYWEVSKNDGDFERFDSYELWYQKMGFLARDGSNDNAEFTIRPVSRPADTTRYPVIFVIGDYAIQTYFAKGTHNISDVSQLQSVTPFKASTAQYGYLFTGWDCGDTFEVKGDSEPLIIWPMFEEVPAVYTVTFATPYGELSTGGQSYSTTAEYEELSSVIDAFKANNSAFSDENIDGVTYSFLRWEGNISYGNYPGSHSAVFTAIWTSENVYTITYDAGGGIFGASYGGGETYTTTAVASEPFGLLRGDSVTKEDNYNTYAFAGWKDENGTVYTNFDPQTLIFDQSVTFTPTDDMTFTAVYTATPKVYTVIVSAGGGKFADGTTVNKVYKGGYDEATGINPEDIGTPTKDSTEQYTYTFSGWLHSGTGDVIQTLPETFSENVTYTAQFTQTPREYTITFNANGGTFPGGGTTYTKDYAYGATIDPAEVPEPTREENTYYTFTFAGWDFYRQMEPVTGKASYYARWEAVPKGAALPSGILISNDGEHFEDIITSSIEGFTYTLEPDHPFVPVYHLPTLTITGNGLTVSGAVNGIVDGIEDTVYIVIDSAVTDVTFKDLSLTTNHETADMVYTERGSLLTVTIAGDCTIEIGNDGGEGGYRDAIRNYRDVLLKGADNNARLSITAEKANGISAFGDITFEGLNLTMEISGVIYEYEDERQLMATAFSSDGNFTIRFADSDVTVKSPGSLIDGDVVIAGNTNFEYISADESPALTIGYYDYDDECYYGKLIFEDFTGRFQASFEEASVEKPVVAAAAGITFMIGGEETVPSNYGVKVGLCSAEIYYLEEYYTFVDDDGEPLSEVTVERQ